ncbi:hypothetical protein FGO68_gene2033 [Halteria grandinella]|uniref:Uncharacterized protein n=1 Tax=Halteria grandinella TaxID=5974 RepID=A0A8J8NPA1_HALGN|nr:hypothetical protein FGO68_gene2033 [Halteria grandinella]
MGDDVMLVGKPVVRTERQLPLSTTASKRHKFQVSTKGEKMKVSSLLKALGLGEKSTETQINNEIIEGNANIGGTISLPKFAAQTPLLDTGVFEFKVNVQKRTKCQPEQQIQNKTMVRLVQLKPVMDQENHIFPPKLSERVQRQSPTEAMYKQGESLLRINDKDYYTHGLQTSRMRLNNRMQQQNSPYPHIMLNNNLIQSSLKNYTHEAATTIDTEISQAIQKQIGPIDLPQKSTITLKKPLDHRASQLKAQSYGRMAPLLQPLVSTHNKQVILDQQRGSSTNQLTVNHPFFVEFIKRYQRNRLLDTKTTLKTKNNNTSLFAQERSPSLNRYKNMLQQNSILSPSFLKREVHQSDRSSSQESKQSLERKKNQSILTQKKIKLKDALTNRENIEASVRRIRYGSVEKGSIIVIADHEQKGHRNVKNKSVEAIRKRNLQYFIQRQQQDFNF